MDRHREGQTAKKCFVISPIGAEDSETRRHADTVFNCIIAPACEPDATGAGPVYAPERGDHKTAPGKITDQIYEDILQADLIIAVLTESNPNVYYELAIAQSAAKPVILLLEKGFDAPFDIKDHRIIYYDFDAQRIFNRTYVTQLRAAMLHIDSRRGRPTVPFAPDLAPLGDPMQAVYARASEAEDETVRLIRSAQEFVWMAGYTLKGWTMNQDFITALTEAAGVLRQDIRTLIMAPDNPSMRPSMKTQDIYESAAQSALVAQTSWGRVFKDIPTAANSLRINTDKSLGYQIVASEQEAIVIPYLTSRDTLRSPYIYARRESFYHEAVLEEYDFLWSHASRPPPKVNAEKPAGRRKSGKANGPRRASP
ncbi:MAG: hypothetical protein AAFY43_08315 [Pseudomonadota bacterium]